jgi:hypothetical protein
VPPSGSTDSFRVLAVGGTELFGQDVPLEGTFSKRLESLLNAAALFSSTGTHHVINGGLWGLSLANQWTALEGLNSLVKPDLVVWVAGEGPVRRPSLDRLQELRSLPPQLHALTAQSRLVALAEMVYLYTAPPEDGPVADLSGRVNRWMDGNPGSFLAVLRLDRNDHLADLKPRNNLLVFEVDKTLGLDLSWKGLTPRGHERLASTAFAILQKYKDRIRPPAVQAPPPEPPKPLRPRKKGRRA